MLSCHFQSTDNSSKNKDSHFNITILLFSLIYLLSLIYNFTDYSST
ncbi:hypothetical protein EOL70_08440 [Leucothrix sargassi]|nr:hypothetical protein EOL70_08440 [Leucothrix sargassi]